MSHALLRLAAALAAAWAAVLPAAALAESQPAAVADFESPIDPSSIRASGLRIDRDDSPGSAASGRACLAIRPLGTASKDREEPSLLVSLPPPSDAGKSRALSAWIRAGLSEEPLRFRWLALDRSGRALFQRRFFFDGGDTWHRIEWPLILWRWADESMGDWSEVRAFSLVVESSGWSAMALDDVRLEPGAEDAAGLGSKWLLGAAFGGAKIASVEAHGFLVATDAPGADKAALDAVMERLRPMPAWISRTFGRSVRPVAGTRPVALLVFDDREAYKGFFKRLGTVWRVNITPPKAGGYTLFDIATSYYDSTKGFDRPVYFHEAVHAALARNLRLVPGSRRHSWFQEAVANYLQLCLYPDSLEREAFVRNFAEAPRPDGKGFWKPLRVLLGERTAMQQYAQLASVFAFLAEKHPDWIPGIAQRLAEGFEPADAAGKCGPALEQFEAEWFAWGSAKFKAGTEKSQEPHFALPEEWKPAPGGKD